MATAHVHMVQMGDGGCSVTCVTRMQINWARVTKSTSHLDIKANVGPDGDASKV
jgi:hypothetical protein